MTSAPRRFTLAALDWEPWLAGARDSPDVGASYYRVLHLDPTSADAVSALFAHIHGRAATLPYADRELAIVTESKVDGCAYTAAQHGRLFVQMTRRPEVIQCIFGEGGAETLSDRERAVIRFVLRLAATPPALMAEDIEELRRFGLTDVQIFDLTTVVAGFSWMNRLTQTLGATIASASP